MKNKIWIFALAFLLIGLTSASINTNATECYQENPLINSTCGGLDTGTISRPSSVYNDDVWNSSSVLGSSDTEIFNNQWRVPLGYEAVVLELKYGSQGNETNVSYEIQGLCLPQAEQLLQFKYSSWSPGLLVCEARTTGDYLSYGQNVDAMLDLAVSNYFAENGVTWLKWDYATNVSENSICYQENPTISNLCGGLDTGTQAGLVVTDDWYVSTHLSPASAFYENYTIPERTASVVWKIKDSTQTYINPPQPSTRTIENYQIPRTCLSGDTLQLMAQGEQSGIWSTDYYCMGELGWEHLGNRISRLSLYGSAVIWEMTPAPPTPPTYADTSLYKIINSSGAGLGMFIEILAVALPILLIGLMMVGLVSAVGFVLSKMFTAWGGTNLK